MQAFFKACFTSTSEQVSQFKENDPHPTLINRRNNNSQMIVNSGDIEVVPNKFTVKSGYKKKGYSIDYTEHGLKQQKYELFLKNKRLNAQNWNDNFNQIYKE